MSESNKKVQDLTKENEELKKINEDVLRQLAEKTKMNETLVAAMRLQQEFVDTALKLQQRMMSMAYK
jgi:cell division septum initiation protein DivIVA